MNIPKKHIILIFGLLVVVVLCYTFLRPVSLSFYTTPIVLHEVFSDNSLTGVWEGVEYLQHDCNGCETKNHHVLSITSDSSAILTQEIDQFNVVFRPPFLDVVFGYPKNWNSIQSSKFYVRGKCLVSLSSEPLDSSSVAHFYNYYEDYGCEIKRGEYPIEAFKIEFKEAKIILTP